MNLKRRLEKLEHKHNKDGYPPGPMGTWSDEDLARFLAQSLWQDPGAAAKVLAMSDDELRAVADTLKGTRGQA